LDRPKILIVDDDPNILAILKEVLDYSGDFEVFIAESSKAALNVLENKAIDLLITDEGMPEVSGGELLKIVSEIYPNMVRFMLTGRKTLEMAQMAVNNNLIDGFFTKPWDSFEMQVSITNALLKKKAELENIELKSENNKMGRALRKLELEHPGSTLKSTTDTGSIILDPNDQ